MIYLINSVIVNKCNLQLLLVLLFSFPQPILLNLGLFYPYQCFSGTFFLWFYMSIL